MRRCFAAPTPNEFVRSSARRTKQILRLTRRANQGHTDIIANIVKPAPENRQRVFHLGETIGKDSFNLSKLFHCIFSILFTASK